MPYDIIIVGAGAAGLYTALCLPQHLQVVGWAPPTILAFRNLLVLINFKIRSRLLSFLLLSISVIFNNFCQQIS